MSLLSLATKSPLSWRDRRSSVRYRCHRICHIQPNGTALGMSWGVTMLNLSTRGSLLELRQPLKAGALLVIQSTSDCPSGPLLARVIRVVPWGADRWLCGCALVEPLSEDANQDWLN